MTEEQTADIGELGSWCGSENIDRKGNCRSPHGCYCREITGIKSERDRQYDENVSVIAKNAALEARCAKRQRQAETYLNAATGWQRRAEAAEAELAALRARIEREPVVKPRGLDAVLGRPEPWGTLASAPERVEAEPVGEAGAMPGSNGGFTMAAFKASDVPEGTKLYASPPAPAVTEALRELEALTFVVQHSPNCPSSWLVRLPGKGRNIDMKAYRNNPWYGAHETSDILGFGKTFDEAARAALASREAT